jgi:hypothetical protein
VNAFTDALAALHADPNLSRTVRYRAGGTGPGVDINVIWGEPQREMDFASTGAVVKDIKADVRLVDIASPARGDTMEPLDSLGAIYEVATPPIRDTENLTASLVLKLVS